MRGECIKHTGRVTSAPRTISRCPVHAWESLVPFTIVPLVVSFLPSYSLPSHPLSGKRARLESRTAPSHFVFFLFGLRIINSFRVSSSWLRYPYLTPSNIVDSFFQGNGQTELHFFPAHWLRQKYYNIAARVNSRTMWNSRTQLLLLVLLDKYTGLP